MAEFVQTMKDWKRMCKAMDAAHPNNACDVCLLREWGCPAIYEDDGGIDYAVLAERVEAWAAEHPDPVYPTWAEWLLKVGVARRVPIGEPWPVELPDGSMLEPYCDTVVKEDERIPADIAQKLGIEPKEVDRGT